MRPSGTAIDQMCIRDRYGGFAIAQSTTSKGKTIAGIVTVAALAALGIKYMALPETVTILPQTFQQFNPFFVVVSVSYTHLDLQRYRYGILSTGQNIHVRYQYETIIIKSKDDMRSIIKKWKAGVIALSTGALVVSCNSDFLDLSLIHI